MIQQNVPVQEIQDAGGLAQWMVKMARNPPPPPQANASITSEKRCAEPKKGAASQARSTPQAKGRRPEDRLVGYGADRMNKLEAKYAAHLEAQRRAGRIIFWRYEAVKFRLADRTWYSPDFYIMRPDGTIEIHETKGWMQDDAAVKIKATAEQFPEFWFVLVKWDKGDWMFKRYRVCGQ